LGPAFAVAPDGASGESCGRHSSVPDQMGSNERHEGEFIVELMRTKIPTFVESKRLAHWDARYA